MSKWLVSHLTIAINIASAQDVFYLYTAVKLSSQSSQLVQNPEDWWREILGKKLRGQ